MASFNQLLGQAFEAYNAGRNDEAEAICRKLVALEPKEGQVVFLLGMILRKGPRKEEAAQWLKQAAALQPRSPEVFNAFGSASNDLGDHARAVECFARAIQLDPRYADAHYNLGNTWQRLREYGKATTSYRRALELNPLDYEAWANLGATYKELNQVEEAISVLDRALQIQPEFPLAHWNRAIVLLLAGRLPEGLQEYEWRWRMGGLIFAPRQFSQPMWRGEAIREKTLFVHAEQGFGDAIQFVRYVRLARQRAARVVLECPPPLQSLFAEAGCADVIIALGQNPPPFDCYVPLMSLPRLFQTTLATIPGDVPYLVASAYQNLPEALAGHLKVGLAWAGNATRDGDSARSLRLEDLAPLLVTPGVTFFSLQVPMPLRDEALAQSLPNLVNLADRLKDFRHTAAVIGQMDLVISVDTAVAHLAGALGKPTWTILQYAPDWRWFLERLDSPWYPTMRLFRQRTRGDWQPVIQLLAAELRRLLSADGDSGGAAAVLL